jgi:hypothetical protein
MNKELDAVFHFSIDLDIILCERLNIVSELYAYSMHKKMHLIPIIGIKHYLRH